MCISLPVCDLNVQNFCAVCGNYASIHWTYFSRHPPPRHFPLPDNSCSLFTGLGGYFSRFHPPVNNIKRSTVNVYKIDSGRSVRVRSIRDSASFQMFALTAGWNVQRLDGDRGKLSGPGKCPEGNMSDLLKHCHCHNVQSQLQRSDVTSEWENDPGK